MTPVEACRMCLSVDARMYVVAGTPLQAVYEKLTNKQILGTDGKPVMACYLCHHMLKKSRTFIDQSLRADALLQQIQDHGLELSLTTISAVASASLRPGLKSSVAQSMAVGFLPPEQGCVKYEGIKIKTEDEQDVTDDVGVFVTVNATGRTDTQSQQCLNYAEDLIVKTEEGNFSRSNVEDLRMVIEESESADTKNGLIEQRDINGDEGQAPRDVKTVEVKCELGVEFKPEILEDMKSFRLEAGERLSLPDTADNGVKCNECDEMFYSRLNLIQHMRIHKKNISRDPTAKNDNVDLTSNVCAHTGGKPYRCIRCGKEFKQKSHFDAHLRIHTGERPYLCNQCDKSFNIRGHLNRHLVIHTGVKPYRCNQCDRAFVEKSHLKTHNLMHTGEKPFACNECDKAFTQKSLLNAHIAMMHTGIKPYLCNQCAKTFTRKGELLDHIKIHTGEKAYSCSQCDKAFSRKCHLNRHITTHTGGKPYRCDQCDKAFSQKYYLNRHMISHTGKKTHLCSHCEKAFSQRGDLSKHIRTIHAEAVLCLT